MREALGQGKALVALGAGSCQVAAQLCSAGAAAIGAQVQDLYGGAAAGHARYCRTEVPAHHTYRPLPSTPCPPAHPSWRPSPSAAGDLEALLPAPVSSWAPLSLQHAGDGAGEQKQTFKTLLRQHLFPSSKRGNAEPGSVSLCSGKCWVNWRSLQSVQAAPNHPVLPKDQRSRAGHSLRFAFLPSSLHPMPGSSHIQQCRLLCPQHTACSCVPPLTLAVQISLLGVGGTAESRPLLSVVLADPACHGHHAGGDGVQLSCLQNQQDAAGHLGGLACAQSGGLQDYSSLRRGRSPGLCPVLSWLLPNEPCPSHNQDIPPVPCRQEHTAGRVPSWLGEAEAGPRRCWSIRSRGQPLPSLLPTSFAWGLCARPARASRGRIPTAGFA